MNKRLISRFLTSIILLSTVIATTAVAQQPTLSYTCQSPAEYWESTSPFPTRSENVPQVYRDFHGLFLDIESSSYAYPLATSIFFDSGRAVIPDRYILFTDPSQTEGFADSKLPGGTLQQYYHGLNILGYRLRKYPDAVIGIVGCNSHQRLLGEIRELSKLRAESVYNYLVNIWQIDPARIKVLPPRDLPAHPSDATDSLGVAENRRVELISSDWRIVGSIFQYYRMSAASPDTMHFQMHNGIPDSLVASREIVIVRGGKPWDVMREIGVSEQVSPGYNWGREGIADSLPDDSLPYVAQLIVHTRDGHTLRSNQVNIPVKIERTPACRDCNPSIESFALPLFSFDEARLNAINQRALQAYVYPAIRAQAKIQTTGYTDIIGSEDHNLGLSERRADAVVRDLKKKVREVTYASLDQKGAGETSPLYTNDLPEGRFYNRTVLVIVRNVDTRY